MTEASAAAAYRTPLDDAPDLCRLGAATLARRYADRSCSPVEAAEAALARAAAIQQRFNPFSHLDPEGALAAARASEARWLAGSPLGPLDGVPVTIKDIVWVRGWTVRYGTRTSPGVNAAEDAPAVAQLRAAGAVLLGLTTTPEFGWKAVTDSVLTGVTRNPWDAARTTGGSSGGAAAACACGAGVLHLGTDGGGSIRIPAGFCGVVGHKPTFGRVPAYPASSFGTIAHLGAIARSVADAALMLQAMSGRDLRDWQQSPWPVPEVAPLAAACAARPARGGVGHPAARRGGAGGARRVRPCARPHRRCRRGSGACHAARRGHLGVVHAALERGRRGAACRRAGSNA